MLFRSSHGQRSLVGCSPWGREESDTTELLHFDFSLSCIGEQNGNPLQCSCLENLRDGGGSWAAVYRVAQSRTRLKRLRAAAARCSTKFEQASCSTKLRTSTHLPFPRTCGNTVRHFWLLQQGEGDLL